MGLGTSNTWGRGGTFFKVSGLICLVWKSGSNDQLKWVLLYVAGLMTF